MREYRNMNLCEPGSIVEYIMDVENNSAGFVYKKLYVVDRVQEGPDGHIFVRGDDASDNGKNNFRLLQTHPGSSAQIGDICIRIRGGSTFLSDGETFVVLGFSHYGNLIYDVNADNPRVYIPSNVRVVERGDSIVSTVETETQTTDTITEPTTEPTSNLRIPAQKNIASMFYKS